MPRENTGGDQFGSSLRVMVQHARVVVGASSYYH